MTTSKPVVFCLDKSTNSILKQCLYNFSPRFFTDGKYLLKSVLLSKKTEYLPLALILTGDYHSIKDIVTNSHTQSIKIFIFCPNLSRQTYEPLMIHSNSSVHLMGLFTIIEDLRDALENTLINTTHRRQLIRFITDNLDSYLWYELLKETSMKIETVPPKQPIDIANINRQIEYNPFLTLYTLRSSIRYLSEQSITHKKIFYGTVIHKDLIDKFQSNLNNIIVFNSFVQHQGHHRTLDARHQSLQCCSRSPDEVSIVFELESATQPTYKIIRIFNSNDESNLWIVQLIGTHECVKLVKQFSHVKRSSSLSMQWQRPEMLFGYLLIEMNEIEQARRFFLETLVNQYDRLNEIYTKVKDLWEKDGNYREAIGLITMEFEQIKLKKTNQTHEELTYMESEFDSIWDPPIALTDANKISDLLAPISYRVDQVLFGRDLPKSSTNAPSRRRCTLL